MGSPRNTELLFNLGLDGEAVTVPPEATRDVVAGHGLVASYDVLKGTGEDVTVVRKTGGERRPVVEDELGEMLRSFQLRLERIDLIPE